MASSKHSARSLRLRLLVLLLIPLLSLAVLWAFAAYLTTGDALGKYEASTTYEKVAVPGTTLATALEQERVSAAVLMSTAGGGDRDGVTNTRASTDAAQAAFRRSALSGEARRTMSETTRQRLNRLLTQLDGLAGVRAKVDAGGVDAVGVINDYDAVVDALLHLFGGMVLINDPDVYRQGTALISVSTAHEFMMRENALVSAALATRAKRFTGPEYMLFTRNAANGRYLFDSALAEVKPSLRGPLQQLAGSSEFGTLRSLEDAIVAAGPTASLAPRAKDWHAAITPLMTTWSQTADRTGSVLTAESKPIGDRIMFMLYAAAGFGLLAVVCSIVVSVLFGRSLTRELTGLQRAALDLAERLPQVVRRLRAGEKVDVEAEVPPVEAGRSREVTRVADALTTLQRTAVQAAIGEARLRQGINQVFLNLAWRSQSLLHRQLSMLDTMERQASDPDALEGLFALDHLTTRMRRHAEGLVILSGAAPARGWHHPVAVRDILAAAIAEVEDYTRVLVEAAAPAALDGSVVADVTHLLAELIENATAFSPPPTQVHVRGELAVKGYAVEIEDRGIGMNEAELADANQRLAYPPEFDLADSDRLGLFIVGRLAARHGIDVRLTASPYGGTRAVVLVPLDFIAGDDGSGYEQAWQDEPSADTGRPATPPWRPPGRAMPPLPAGAGTIGLAASDGTDPDAPELPRRVRQASLAPQLRDDTRVPGPASGPEDVGREETGPADTGPTTRPPEETRSLMTALQQGWQRGREEEDPDE
ncbi:sensor histidine kinase [Actinoallomurus sp. NBC_01490]|uniref:sensor histidine kinase n=1 Tax=Actinoallomurus sp. NBC_01490 TaxID=2903557 RepID=UPI002E2EE8E3|nr:sensor histidine kinase [Actinoallomurus sp. NBC_01490]